MQNQAIQQTNQTIVDFALSIFDVDSNQVTAVDEALQTVMFESSNFNYELLPMFNDPSEVELGRGNAVDLRYAGEDGSTRSITVQAFVTDGQQCIVEYDVWQPAEYNDEDWVCFGHLTLTVVDPETLESVMAEKTREIQLQQMEHSVGLAIGLLSGAVSQETPFKDVMDALLSSLWKTSTYVLDVETDNIEEVDADRARALYEAGKRAGKRLDRAWGGAYLARMLKNHPEVESFKIDFETSTEYDDNNYYDAKNVALSELKFVGEATEAIWPDGKDAESAEKISASDYADSLQDEIRDDGDEWTLYDAFQPEDESDEFSCVVRRANLASLLEAGKIDGHAAWEAIAPTIKAA